MRHIAIIGSGPAGFYTAEAALKMFGDDVRIDILDRLPTPYGLIRAGVAPDHQSIKAVSRRYEQVALDSRVRFVGQVEAGKDVSVDELLALYDDVVLAVGAPQDRRLGVPGDDLPGVIGSSAFVGWYNGHPDFTELNPPLEGPVAAIIGNGNVAIDCARILAKTMEELEDSDIVNHALETLRQSGLNTVHLIGRRGPLQASFTLKEVGELGELQRATPHVQAADFPSPEADAALETGQRRVVEVLRRYAEDGPDAAKPVGIHLDFYRRPVRVIGDGRVEGIELMRTRVDDSGRAVDTGETAVLKVDLLISAIGYRSVALPGVPFDEANGRFVNDEGLIAPSLWCVGWARRGPSGTIGTNRPDGFALVERIAAQNGATRAKVARSGGAGLDDLLDRRGVQAVRFEDWQRIDAAEIAAARPGAPREKFVSMEAFHTLLKD